MSTLIPMPPTENQNPWFIERNNFDQAVRTRLNNELSDAKLGETFEMAGRASAVKLAMMPTRTDGTRQWNGSAFTQDALWTLPDGSRQYAVWVDENRNPIVGRRAMPEGEWVTFDLSQVSGNPLQAPTEPDSHNVYAIGIDSAGHIHIAGNMHADGLRYVVSTNPHDLTSWQAGVMVGDNETQVTYPQFFRHPDGDLFFTYRQGGSGDGNQFLNRRSGSGAWQRVGEILNGSNASENAYVNHVVCDEFGVIHMAYTWRWDVGSVTSTNDICYIKSSDKGVSWTSVTGDPLMLPITHAQSPVAIDTPNTTLLVNQGGFDVDKQGRPHIGMVGGDATETNRNLIHVWWDGSQWHKDVVTRFTETGTVTTRWPQRPAVACSPDGRTYMIYTHIFDGKQGAIRAIDVTPGVASFEEFVIAHVDVRQWEPTYDTQALRLFGLLHMLVGPVNSDGGVYVYGYNENDNWSKQWVGVLTVDMRQVSALQKGAVDVPRLRHIASSSLPYGTLFTNTSLSGLSVGVVAGAEMRGRTVLARLTVYGTVSAGTELTVRLRERATTLLGATVTRMFGTVKLTETGVDRGKQTPWMPLDGPLVYNLANLVDGSTSIDAVAQLSSAGTATLRGCQIELAVLG